MNIEHVQYLNLLLGAGAIVLQLFTVVALFLLFIGPKKNAFLGFIDKHYLTLAFLISLTSALFSLVYSEIVGFLPCYLCWYQRIFMFPMIFIFGAAIWNKDRHVVRYTLPLLSVGFIFAVYQNFFYYFGEGSTLPCDASGVSCYQQLINVYGGYISFPMLSLTVFAALITIVLTAHFYKKED
jgi:disulfide bond formation protein DsbB